jgi:starch synthase
MVTIHNLAYQGWLSRKQLAGLAAPDEIAQLVGPHADGLLLLREGVKRAELVNTVSPGYAAEVLTEDFGMGMEKVLAGLGHRFGGILNGLDTAIWDPADGRGAAGQLLARRPGRARRNAAARC